MNLLNTNHKLILSSLLITLFSNFIIILSLKFDFELPFIQYFLPEPIFWSGWRNVPIFLEFFVPILGVGILFFAISKKSRKIEFALIPILFFYAYIFPWWIFQYPEDILYILPNIVCFGLLFYGTYFLIMPTFLSLIKNSEKKQKYQPSEELSEIEFLPTLILCFFVGFLGIHRFFVGKVGTGILMIVTLGGLGIWVLVDFIMICIGSFRDIEGHIIKYQRVVVIKSEGSVAAELEKFAELKDKGVISEEEFNKKKEELL